MRPDLFKSVHFVKDKQSTLIVLSQNYQNEYINNYIYAFKIIFSVKKQTFKKNTDVK